MPRSSASVPIVTTSDGSANEGDDGAVQRTSQRADDHARQHRRLDRQALLSAHRDRHSAQADHRADRDVDLTAHDDQRHRQRHDRHRHDTGDRDGKVGGSEEVFRVACAEHERDDSTSKQERLPPPRYGPSLFIVLAWQAETDRR